MQNVSIRISFRYSFICQFGDRMNSYADCYFESADYGKSQIESELRWINILHIIIINGKPVDVTKAAIQHSDKLLMCAKLTRPSISVSKLVSSLFKTVQLAMGLSASFCFQYLYNWYNIDWVAIEIQDAQILNWEHITFLNRPAPNSRIESKVSFFWTATLMDDWMILNGKNDFIT